MNMSSPIDPRLSSRGATWGSSRALACLSLSLDFGLGRGKHAEHHNAVPGKGPETVTVPICARARPGPGDRAAGANSLNSIHFEGRQIPSSPLVISDLDMSRTAWRRLVPTRAME